MKPAPDAQSFAEYIFRQESKDQLRFITCGSVDDGKSTLIGRLLYDAALLYEDQLAALRQEVARQGHPSMEIDFANLVDGLEAELEQKITIDVAYRYFSTAKRKFIVADTPGHEQYTRNMATGASTADLAVILVDARKGLLTQTRRHSFIASLLGIRHVILAVNKIDLTDYSQEVFEAIASEYRIFAAALNFATVTPIPVSARFGDNITRRSDKLAWYDGPPLLDLLQSIEIASSKRDRPFRMPVQWVNRPHQDFRGFSGTIASGSVRPGDAVTVVPSGRTTTVSRIVTHDGDLPAAAAGQAVTLVLADEVDVSRGDLLSSPTERPALSDQFSANLIWMHEAPMIPGRSYLFKFGSKLVTGSITAIKHRVNVDTMEPGAARQFELNEIGLVNLAVGEQIAVDAYKDSRATGGFIVIDRLSNQTVGAGTINFPLRRSENIHWQAIDLDKKTRSQALGQRPFVLWFTGLSGAGKSTIANLVEKRLFSMNRHTYLLDGDNVRHGLNHDLGFTEADRVENIRRIGETAKLFVDAGLIVLCSFISPYRSERRMVRELLEPGEFVEVFVDAPLEIAERRDPKGLYRKARAGELQNFTGIDSPYEAPQAPEIHLAAGSRTPDELAQAVIDYLREHRHVS
ncbi:sulfate adenylyltransferase subunit CysN [Nitratireductor sp. ZSWI3]|uniref:sulfate adenylyltransferase subunit CysN n=1 Tax=Nitratireductor sp. ZSWI3 TaxID=2966359 RepID=UPI0021503A70|nr:sulfate adenylyltransferase subunit CysN [Nitratireductor sp. ZSWI3]MCR4265868.1 sulfate adenylyltransferase subunit CysN [Nitratireductor sp. ZSWI3]